MSRRVIAAAFVSLDGVIQAPGGPDEDPTGGFALGGWTAHYWDAVMEHAMAETFARPFDLLLGRKTYEIFAAHWPYAGDDDPVTQAFNAATKYVATRSDQAFAWQNTVALRGDVAAQVAKLKAEDGPDLLTQGSSVLLQTLLEHDLIDELSLMIFPLLLGKGKRLFGDGTAPAALELVDSKTASTGVIVIRYRRAGAIATGSFALDPPTRAELERRETMKREG